MTMRMASTDQISKCVRYFLIGASLDFLASKELLILTLPQKVARQLFTVARWPQKINDCAMADRIPIRYDETLLVKRLPSLPVRMRAGSPGARRGFFFTAANRIALTSPPRKRQLCRSSRPARP